MVSRDCHKRNPRKHLSRISKQLVPIVPMQAGIYQIPRWHIKRGFRMFSVCPLHHLAPSFRIVDIAGPKKGKRGGIGLAGYEFKNRRVMLAAVDDPISIGGSRT